MVDKILGIIIGLLLAIAIQLFVPVESEKIENEVNQISYITVEQKEFVGSFRGRWRSIIIRSYDRGPWVVISPYGEHLGELSRIHRGLDPDEFKETKYRRIAPRRR